MKPTPLLWLAASAIFVAYGLGLGGTWVLDDHINLAPVWAVLQGTQDTWTALTGNASGPGGRPLAYLTFLLNARVDTAPLGFKLVNLALHVAAASLALLLTRRVFAPHAALALFVVALWALHPAQVSTVLYVVQRMTLLAAIAQLGAVLLFLRGRAQVAADPAGARITLFCAFPLVVLAGALCKETALLAPLLCAGAEITLFARATRPRIVLGFFAAFLVVPALLAVGLAWTRPDLLWGGYPGREFTPGQRLMTEPRVLWHYVGEWLWPAGASLYRDGFAASQGWLQPWTTALSLLGWFALAMTAWLARVRNPRFAFGIAWFLAAHALEAGPFALELYFSHRNYLPALGLLIAAAALAEPHLERVPTRALGAAALVLLATCALFTAERSWHWGDPDRLLAREAPPVGEVSRRLQVDRAIRALERDDIETSLAALEPLARGSAGDRASAAVWKAIIHCFKGRAAAGDGQAMALMQHPPPVLTHNQVSALRMLSRLVREENCPSPTVEELRAVVRAWRASARQPMTDYAVRELDALEASVPASSARP